MSYSDHSVRRIVTTHSKDDMDGSKVEVIDQVIKLKPFAAEGNFITPIFTHEFVPSKSSHQIDEKGIEKENELTSHVILKNGVKSCIMDMAPNGYFPPHRTSSIDHALVLNGSVELIIPKGRKEDEILLEDESKLEYLEFESIKVNAGEVIIQRGTTHAWRAGREGLRFFSILIDAKPVVVEESGRELPEFW